ncbi:hypothetical protein [Adhaeribacter arboris]|nr:hypothetical protein [Adhaeribacter arboris]
MEIKSILSRIANKAIANFNDGLITEEAYKKTMCFVGKRANYYMGYYNR